MVLDARSVGGLVAAALAVAAPARAANTEPSFAWSAPAECPDRASVIQRVQRIAGPNAPEPWNVVTLAEVAKRDVYELVITTRKGQAVETRTASSASCAALGEAAAIIVAVALSPSRGAGPRAEPAAELARLEAVTEGARPPPVRPLPTPADRSPNQPVSRPAIGLGVGMVFDAGTLPRSALGIEAIAAVTIDRFQLGLAGSLWARAEQRYADGAAGAHFDVVDAGPFGCWLPWTRGLRVGGCAEVDVTLMSVESFGIRQPGTARLLWPTMRGGLLAELALTRSVFLFARADAAFAIAVPRVVLTTVREGVALHEASVPALRTALGIRVDLL